MFHEAIVSPADNNNAVPPKSSAKQQAATHHPGGQKRPDDCRYGRRGYLPNILSTMKIRIAPPKPPPHSKYSSDQPAAATIIGTNARSVIILKNKHENRLCQRISAPADRESALVLAETALFLLFLGRRYATHQETSAAG